MIIRRIRRTFISKIDLLGDSLKFQFAVAIESISFRSTREKVSSSFYIQALYGIKTHSFFRFGFQVISLQAVHAREDHRT
jgi:hypothetical protein